jgi:hypothetical protein
MPVILNNFLAISQDGDFFPAKISLRKLSEIPAFFAI